MIFYQISFGPYCKGKYYDEAENLIHEYLSSLLHNGQIAGHYTIVPWNGEVVAYVNAQGCDANLLKYHSQWGKDDFHKINEFFGQVPVWKCNEDFLSKRKTNWKNAPFLYFTTDFFESDLLSLLARGDTADLISLYRVPIPDQAREDAYFWQAKYRSLYKVWLDSGDLEMQVYRLLAEPDSKCSKCGRELCLAIEKATNVPTYYYLMRYHGREYADEKKRLCPGCGKSWFVKRPEKKEDAHTPFWEFDFQCKKCRLVSHIACDVNLRYAKIGEPKTKHNK